MTAEEIRDYVLTVHGPLAEAERLREEGPDGPPWWLGSCDSTCAVLDEELDLAPFAMVEWGGFLVDDAGSSEGHCWLQAPDGTIVDPTSRQFGLDHCLIVRPGDHLHHRYRQPAGDEMLTL